MRVGFSSLQRAGRKLWRSGLLCLNPKQAIAIASCWWFCRSSYAFLAGMAAVRWGSRIALRDEEGELTFAELYEHSLLLAGQIYSEHRLDKKCQIGLLARNHRGFVLGLLAATRLGVDVLPLPPQMPLRVLKDTVLRQRLSLILHDEEFSSLVTSLPCAIANLDDYGLEPKVYLPRAKKSGELVVLTSGTSGVSKGIRRRPTLGQVLPLFVALLATLPIKLHAPIVLAIPLYHGYGLASLAMSLALGAPLHLRRRYDIKPMLAQLSAGERPFLISIPTLLGRWLQESGDEAKVNLQAIVTGSAPLEPKLCLALLAKFGPVLYNLYGSTEAGLTALATPEILSQAPGSVGLALPGNEVKLASSNASAKQPAEVWVRGPFAIPSRPEGWRETGDLGSFDKRGYLYIHGRIDGMIVSGGENVYPHEVEAVLRENPLVLDCALLAVDDLDFGKRLEAVVTIKPGAKLDEVELGKWLKSRLERHKLPRKIHFLDGIPKNALGKVDRVALYRALNG